MENMGIINFLKKKDLSKDILNIFMGVV